VLQLWKILGLLNSSFPFEAIFDLFCPFYEFHLLQVVPDIVFPSGLGSSYWSSCKSAISSILPAFSIVIIFQVPIYIYISYLFLTFWLARVVVVLSVFRSFAEILHRAVFYETRSNHSTVTLKWFTTYVHAIKPVAFNPWVPPATFRGFASTFPLHWNL